MKKLNRKYVVGVLIPAIFIGILIVLFIVTGIVYTQVFKRFDKEPETGYSSREEFTFMSGENKLTGFLYGRGASDLIVFVSGFRAIQDDYLPLVKALIAEDFAVFTFDPTGVGRSEGEDQVSYAQIVHDLDACLDFIDENGHFGCTRISIVGHSRGGFAACMEASRVDSVVAAGGLASNMDGVLHGAYTKVGGLAYLNYPMLWLWQTAKFGQTDTNMDAITALMSCDTDVLIIQGTLDESVPKNRFSLFSKIAGVMSNASVVQKLVPYGHVDMLYTESGANPETVQLITKFIRFNDMKYMELPMEAPLRSAA
ncbi:MAG: alpha/beta fold hydrolase [Clostridia bacterium]|nr:alpha/beta fold hydrolase [Clostridia bacterium]